MFLAQEKTFLLLEFQYNILSRRLHCWVGWVMANDQVQPNFECLRKKYPQNWGWGGWGDGVTWLMAPTYFDEICSGS